MDIPLFIFLSVIMIVFGYITGNSRSFNVWKLLLLGIALLPFVDLANMGRPQLFTMLRAFLLGYLLPYADMLKGVGEGLSNVINALRYRSAYDDIRRKEEEVEALRRHYEQAQREAIKLNKTTKENVDDINPSNIGSANRNNRINPLLVATSRKSGSPHLGQIISDNARVIIPIKSKLVHVTNRQEAVIYVPLGLILMATTVTRILKKPSCGKHQNTIKTSTVVKATPI